MITFIVQQIEDIFSAKLTPGRHIWSNLTKDLLNTVHCDLDQAFSTLALWTFWTRKYFTVGGCPVYRRIFSSILGPNRLEASSTAPPNCDSQKCLQTLPNIPWEGVEVGITLSWEPLI